MSKLEDAFVVIEDDEEDKCFSSSSSRSSRETKISFSQKGKTSVRKILLTKSKSFSSKTSSKSVLNSLVPSKRQNSWISSSFDGFRSAVETSNKKSKQTDLTTAEGLSSQQVKKDENLWIDKYKPQSETELAVHKKKIEDVRSWLLDNLVCPKSSAILLLTGPVGAGKSATIHALSKELTFEIQEWINPVIHSFQEGSSFGADSFTSRFATSQSQLSQFQDFLLRSNKYPTLSIFGSSNVENIQRKVILIEDLPNIFYRDAKKFQEVLMAYKQTGRCPLVLIISDSHHDDSNVHKLLPKTIHTDLGVTTISFNPVAHTSLMKTLNRIVSLESKKSGKSFSLPSKEVINELAQSSAGDIRTAINALQFSCQRGIQDNVVSLYKASNNSSSRKIGKNSSQGTHSKKTKPQESQIKRSAGGIPYSKDDKEEDLDVVKAIGGKDTTIFLFRALGKILYCKRDPSVSDKDLLPSNMAHLARNQPQFCPEDVVERAHLSSEMLTLYLHQNYLDFFTDIDDVVLASECLSDSNMMSVEWTHRTSLIPYMVSMATRGFMFYNSQAAGTSRSGWRPLHKPQWFDVNKKVRVNNQTAKELFTDETCSATILHTQIIPYLAITDVPLKTPGQIAFVQQMGKYQKSKFAYRSDTLDEKDCAEDTDDGELTDSQSLSQQNRNENTATQTKTQETQKIEPEENEIHSDEKDIVIEDFEDDW